MSVALAEIEQPETAHAAISASEAAARVLASHNMLQPYSESDWPDTLGVAFRKIANDVVSIAQSIELGEQAVRADMHTPLTLNNFAWDLATAQKVTPHSAERSVFYSLLGWAPNIKPGNRADTVACALAAYGEFDLAIAFADYAIHNASNREKLESFQKTAFEC